MLAIKPFDPAVAGQNGWLSVFPDTILKVLRPFRRYKFVLAELVEANSFWRISIASKSVFDLIQIDIFIFKCEPEMRKAVMEKIDRTYFYKEFI